MIRAVVDVQAVQSAQHPERGVARYVAELGLALAELDRVAVFAHDPSLPRPPVLDRLAARAPLVSLEDPQVERASVYHVGSPFEAERPGRALLPPGARGPGTRRVATLYDLIPLVMPDAYLATAPARAAYRRGLELVRACDALVTISAASAADAVRLLGVSAARLHVVHAGAGEQFRPPTVPTATLVAELRRALPALTAPYVLAPSGMDPRKNWSGVLEAFARLDERTRRGHQLVLACRVDDGQRAHVVQVAGSLGIADRLVLTDVLDDDDLVRLYQAAHLVVFASRYEGYGLPPLEARRCGAPVLCADNSSLREVVTDARARFDADDVDALAALLDRALTDERWRAELAAAPVVDHTWARAAERTAAVYDAVAGDRRRYPGRRPPGPPAARPPATAPRPLVRVPAAADPVVSVCMVLYRGGRLALDALEALAAHTPEPVEVIVVDNCSPDGSGALVRAGTRGARILPSAVNLGFGPAMNLAAATARGRYLCLLNPDAVVEPGWLAPLLARIGRPGVGAVAPLLLEMDGVTPQEAGGVIDRHGAAAHVGSVRWGADGATTTARVIDYASAACLLVRADAFAAVGGFDPRYRLAYYEDADLAFALGAAGYRLWFEPGGRVRHHKGGTDAGGAAAALAAENQPRFTAKWAGELAPRPSLAGGPAARRSLRDWRADHRILLTADVPYAAVAAWRAAAPHGALVAVGPEASARLDLAPLDVELVDVAGPDGGAWLAARQGHDDVLVVTGDPAAVWRTAARAAPELLVVAADADPLATLRERARNPRSPRFVWPAGPPRA